MSNRYSTISQYVEMMRHNGGTSLITDNDNVDQQHHQHHNNHQHDGERSVNLTTNRNASNNSPHPVSSTMKGTCSDTSSSGNSSSNSHKDVNNHHHDHHPDHHHHHHHHRHRRNCAESNNDDDDHHHNHHRNRRRTKTVSQPAANNNNNVFSATSINGEEAAEEAEEDEEEEDDDYDEDEIVADVSTTDGSCASRFSSFVDCESLKSAILDSFRMHWAQAWSIMEAKISAADITMDDLSSIINHIEQMISLLVEENVCVAEIRDSRNSNSGGSFALSPLLDFLFVESILDKVLRWSTMAGEWRYAMYLEQLKLYELLISQLCNQTDAILFRRPFLRPLIRLLDALSAPLSAPTGFRQPTNSINFIEIEKRLVLLLNTLCVAISQNHRLLRALYVYDRDRDDENKKIENETFCASSAATTTTSASASSSSSSSSALSATSSLDETKRRTSSTNVSEPSESFTETFTFPVFLLLTNFVHRDGPIGQQSRDALLLCLAMSRSDESLARYIVRRTDFCPLLATGLSGLFSALPRVVIGQAMSVEQLQAKDDLLARSNELEQLLKSLDFCNAVAQISHPLVQTQLLDYIYHGFLVSVIGPALHQNTLDEIITTTAYLDLFIRSISEPNLIRIFLEFLCFERFDNRCIIETLISRIVAKSKLSLVTLIFFKTLLDLNCEDLQFELIFQYLLRGEHLVNTTTTTTTTATTTTTGATTTVSGSIESRRRTSITLHIERSLKQYRQNWLAISGQKLFSSSLSYYLASLCPHQHTTIQHQQHQQHQHQQQHQQPQYDRQQSSPYFDDNYFDEDRRNRATAAEHCKCHTTYIENYFDYLLDARHRIEQCRTVTACAWKNRYLEPCRRSIEKPSSSSSAAGATSIRSNRIIFCAGLDEDDHTTSITTSTTNKMVENSNYSSTDATILPDNLPERNRINGSFNELYEERQTKSNREIENRLPTFKTPAPPPPPPPPIGSFLAALLHRCGNFFRNDVLTNLHLTGLLTLLCQSPHLLLLRLFFDETLARIGGVSCLLHVLQNLALEAQRYADDFANFETMFRTARINLQSVPIGELNCQLLTTAPHRTSGSSTAKTVAAFEGNISKGIGALKRFFSRDYSVKQQPQQQHQSEQQQQQHSSISRRDSIASLISTNSHHVLEVMPSGVRFINQSPPEINHPKIDAQTEKQYKRNELIYNLIIFDEFLLELSAILTEQSIGDLVNNNNVADQKSHENRDDDDDDDYDADDDHNDRNKKDIL